MKTSHLLWATVVVAALPAGACNRADSRDHARAAAVQVKDVAGRAGEKLADGWLATKIQAQYFADDDVKARNILVTARDGVVTLRGRVDSPDAHDQALQIAKNTDGVHSVNDQLTLGIGSPRAENRPAQPSSETVATTGVAGGTAASVAEGLNDSGITVRIQAKYFLDSGVKARRIEVDTHESVVTVRGEVASDDERAQALILARTTEGVRRVEDGLTVNIALAQPAPAVQPETTAPAVQSETPAPPAQPVATPAQAQGAALTTELESKFAADRQVKGAAIEVSAKDGVVLLEGTVPTAAAKQRVLSLARETKGVIQVIDRVKVGRGR